MSQYAQDDAVWRYVVRGDLPIHEVVKLGGTIKKQWQVCRSYIQNPKAEVDTSRYGPPISWHSSRKAASVAILHIEQEIKQGKEMP